MYLILILGVADNRCYLENGGSAESFFVSEDVQVGSIIGMISTFMKSLLKY